MNSKIPQDWKIWAEENIHNGSDPEELIDEMIKADLMNHCQENLFPV